MRNNRFREKTVCTLATTFQPYEPRNEFRSVDVLPTIITLVDAGPNLKPVNRVRHRTPTGAPASAARSSFLRGLLLREKFPQAPSRKRQERISLTPPRVYV